MMLYFELTFTNVKSPLLGRQRFVFGRRVGDAVDNAVTRTGRYIPIPPANMTELEKRKYKADWEAAWSA